jgi:elongation factor Ts
MTEITAALVKDLREKTGAGMMDCKRALTEVGGDVEAAIDWLRQKGLAAAAKKSSRIASEGLIGVASETQKAAVVEVNAETDFVARNPTFQTFVEQVAKIALAIGDDLEKIKAAPFPGTGRSVADELTHLVATVGENMNLRRAKVLSAPDGIVATYVHGSLKPGLGKIGVIVAISGEEVGEALHTLGRQVGMHVAATRPDALDISSVSPEALEREKRVLTEQAKASGRPDHVIDRMVEGRVQKFYEEVALLEQVWVHDGKSRVKDVANGASATITGFARFALGEGIEKPKDDFAAEVAATAAPPPKPAAPGGTEAPPLTPGE